ncbi:MAG: patatin-like phospholipase family protein [Candidatus Cryptobacteroides sp.]
MRLRLLISVLAVMTLFSSRQEVYAMIQTQGQSERTVNYGLNPSADSVSVAELRQYLDGIRRTRPTVALVLSGGGAKGAAHIGVIDYLDSLEIPVDVVLGTSMGGLVGGLYSLGYSASDMESVIRGIDWDMALSDKVPRNYISYSTTKYKEKILLSFPFYYEKQDYLDRKADEERYGEPDRRHEQIHVGAGKDDAVSIVKDNLMTSLPSGFASGQNVNNIFSSLTAGYQDDMNFLDLPVPYICVATDMVTAKPKNWYSGKLTTALRSTMSIPGVFAPVKVDGMVLVDGGMRNNYPADLAREIGADIIIGVDLSSGFKGYSQLNDLKDIISQGVDMLGREAYEKNVSIPDVTIKPYLPEYNMMSFDAKSIDVIISRGHEAAAAQSELLDSIKMLVGPYHKELRHRKAIDLGNTPVRVSKIEMEGVSDRESRYLMGMISLRPDRPLDKLDIEDAVATIYGTGAFDYVTYELEGAEEPFSLILHCKKGPVHQFGIGGRLDSEEMASMIFNVGLNAHKLQGSALDFTGKVGINPAAELKYYVRGPKGPTFNAAFSVKWLDRNRFTLGTSDYNVAYLNVREELYLSNIRLRRFDTKIGLRSDFFKLNNVMANSVMGDYDLNSLTNNYLSLFADLKADTFDDGYFPTRGFSVGLGYEWFFAGLRHDIERFHVATFDFKTVAQMGCFAIIPSIHARYMFGGDPSLPYLNLMGGSIAGRYLDQQIPFTGINYAAAMQNLLTVVRSDFRFRLCKNNYITAIANYAFTMAEFRDFGNAHNIYGIFGAGIKYSYNTIIGPVELELHWRSRNRKTGAYLNIGLYF